MEREILLNGELNTELKHKGFVKLNAIDAGELMKAYKEISVANTAQLNGHQNKVVDVSYHSTFFEDNKAYKQLVFDVIGTLLAPLLKNYFNGYKIIQANIFSKPTGSGYVCPHQNLTTVDETKFTSVSIWIPLQPTNISNGTLFFAPGSHKKFSKFRNFNIDWEPLRTFARLEDYGMVGVDMNVGDVLIFDDSIIHASPVNESGADRIVFHCLAIPQEAKAIYCKKSEDNIDVIEVPDNFWQFFTPGNPEPVGPVIRSEKLVIEKYTPSSILHELSR